jgi:hypothetical protein
MAQVQNITPPAKKIERTVEEATATVTEKVQQTVEAASKGLQDLKDDVTGGLKQASEFARTYADVQRSTYETVVKAGQIYGEGLKGLATHIADVNRTQFEHTVAHFKALSGVKSLKEAFGLQAQFARETTSRALAETGAIVEDYLKVTGEALAPVTAKVREAAEKVKLAA